MNKTEKSKVIVEVAELLRNSSCVFVTDYKGVTVEQVTKLRKSFREKGVTYKVIKNTLFKRALQETGKYEKLADHLTEMSGFVFAGDDPSAPAKIISKFFEDTQKFPLRACYLGTEYYDGSRLKEISLLPTKAEVISGVLSSLEAPITGIVGAIAAVIRDVVGVVDAISKKEAA